MDKSEILEALRFGFSQNSIKLPKNIELEVKNKVLKIRVKRPNQNMQTDDAAFEGWSICLKHHLSNEIDKIVLDWDKPNSQSDSEKLHYNRFLYRSLRFRELFSWFSIDMTKELEINDFTLNLNDLVINVPLNHATEPSEKGSNEKKIEYNITNLSIIKEKFGLRCVDHQLPVGVKRGGQSFFTGRASAIDIWGIDDNHLHIFELKYSNKKVGIITELLFYSEVMYDVLIRKTISTPSDIKDVRNALSLYNDNIKIRSINSYLLFDGIHPLVVGTTALLNKNNLGIKFFNVQYKLKPGGFCFDKLFFKGAFQMEEEIKQSLFNHESNKNRTSYILHNGDDNFHSSIKSDVKKYFDDNDIDWWTFNKKPNVPTNHMVSSQIQCLNFLFAIRKDKEVVLEFAQLFDSEIDDVCQTLNDFDPGFIAFEFAYKNEELLGENDSGAKRGTKCTSIDAFIIAKKGDRKILIPIEWKYTESYFDCENKALEISSGKKRQSRYNHLILSSRQLKPFSDLPNSAYYFEPFYEFMRQTLLVEQMIKRGLADDFLHVVIISEKNEDLLGSSYKFSPDNLEIIWRKCLTDQAKFKLVQNSKLLSIFEKREEHNDLFNYLNQRYFKQ